MVAALRLAVIVAGASAASAEMEFSDNLCALQQDLATARLGVRDLAGASRQEAWPKHKKKEQAKKTQEATEEFAWSNRLLVPSAKLALCYIPKVACNQMTQLFNALNGLGRPVLARKGSEEASVQSDWEFQLSTDLKLPYDWSKATRENGWKFAFFTRDPLERYLSAFLSKCVPGPDGKIESGGVNCHGNIIDWQAPTFAETRRAFEARVFRDAARGFPAQQEHWDPQTEILRRCGAQFEPSSVDFVGHLEGDMNAQVKDMLHLVNISGKWAGNVVDRLFPASRVSGHSSGSHGHIQEFYGNTSVAKAVALLYSKDYTSLQLPLPAWTH